MNDRHDRWPELRRNQVLEGRSQPRIENVRRETMASKVTAHLLLPPDDGCRRRGTGERCREVQVQTRLDPTFARDAGSPL